MKFMKLFATGVLCVTLLMGLTSCLDALGSILNAQHKESTPSTTTESTPVETTPIPQETTGAQETTKKPDEQSTPEETTTKKPEESSTPGETTTNPSETTPPPVVTTPPEETTTPDGSADVPNEDLPADEDGYPYPAFFANLVKETIKSKGLFGAENGGKYSSLVKTQTPQIVFVERAEKSKEENTPIAIYARYKVGNENIYVRMAYTIKSYDYTLLKAPKLYASYGEYIDAVQKALESKAELANADISMLYEGQDDINNQIGEGFAKALGNNFVDASVNSVISTKNNDGISIYQISGFAYDEEGKSYSYVLSYDVKGGGLGAEKVISRLENGTLNKNSDFNVFEVTSTPVAGVFQAPETAE